MWKLTQVRFFEQLSLFAEVFQELLQYKMGSRILSNLEVCFGTANLTSLVNLYMLPLTEIKYV